jgi:hypothetical protein
MTFPTRCLPLIKADTKNTIYLIQTDPEWPGSSVNNVQTACSYQEAFKRFVMFFQNSLINIE